MEAAFDEIGPSPQGRSLLHLDLDGFKQVNGRLGHGAGNALLQTIGQRLRETVGPGARSAARLRRVSGSRAARRL
ncbi:diguanylate cyclase domain-containing protein [Aureimonas sp. AU20]|uniref:diguanylate cyclase domain-containing protein n=1 Tax=Aureimonas sp. AU20 TaxID=1349819 RepID=UPI0035B5A86A